METNLPTEISMHRLPDHPITGSPDSLRPLSKIRCGGSKMRRGVRPLRLKGSSLSLIANCFTKRAG